MWPGGWIFPWDGLKIKYSMCTFWFSKVYTSISSNCSNGVFSLPISCVSALPCLLHGATLLRYSLTQEKFVYFVELCSCVSTVLSVSTETIPFFPDDVTSMFGPLVGDWARSGIVFLQASGCPVGGRGFDRTGDVIAKESYVLWMVVATIAVPRLRQAPRGP